MIRSPQSRTLVLAALLAAAPAFAQTSGASAQSSATTQSQISKEQSSSGTTASGNYSSSLTVPPAAKPMCGSLGASATGSLGDSRDCIPEPVSGVSNPVLPNASTGNSLDATGTFSSSPALSPNPALSTDANATSTTTKQAQPAVK